MSLSLNDLRDRYWLKIGESSDNHSETSDQVDDRLNEAYQYICRITGCTWRKPQLASLSAVTASTNYHDLSSALTLTEGAGVHSIHRVIWDGVQLHEWSKGRIDQQNEWSDTHPGCDPEAFGFFTEGTGDSRTDYICFYPCLSSANTTDCYIEFFERLADMSADADYPGFDSQWHHLIADLAAYEFLESVDSARATPVKLARTIDKINDMKLYYFNMLNIGDLQPSYLARTTSLKRHFYGE